MKFTLYGNIPALKNSKIIITKPFPRLISNPRVVEWTNYAIKQLKELKLDNLNIDYEVSLKIKVWRGSKHRADIDNIAQTIFDSLFNKNNPRAELELEKYVDYK